jgi:hypothetical protein
LDKLEVVKMYAILQKESGENEKIEKSRIERVVWETG